MAGEFFLSYSPVDGAEFALRLADALEAGPPSYSVWVDRRALRPGEDWDEQIAEALRTCRGVLFVMTEDSVKAGSVCKQEWSRALRYKKPVIPLRLDDDAELPFRLGSRQYVAFGDFSTGLARLRQHLAWTSSPDGVLAELKVRLADAGRELPRTEEGRRPVVEAEIVELRRRIDQQQRLIDNPAAEQAKTQDRITAAMTREQRPPRPMSASPSRARFVNPPPVTAPGHFQDRHIETGLVADYLNTPELRMVTVVGRGGVGKTAMVCRLLKALETGRLPDGLPAPGGDGDDDAAEQKRRDGLGVTGIVYLSPTGGHPVSFPNLFADLCQLLPEDTAAALTQRYKDPHQTPTELMQALLEAFPTGRTVVLLDNFEDHIDAGTGEVTDPALDEALRAVLTAPAHGVKVVLTSRVAPRALLLTQPGSQRRLGLDEGLGSPYAENVLRASDPDGSLGLKSASPELLAAARERTRGYPRALEALAAILAADRDTTLPELLTEAAALPDNVVQALVGEAYNRLDPLAQQVMQALAVYPSPVPPVAVDYLLQPYRAAIDATPVLSRLVNMQFVRREGDRYYLHQVDRDYALLRLPDSQPGEPDTTGMDAEAGPPPFTRKALELLGADYYAETRKPRESWKTLDDLAPQLAEHELRYQAGDYDAAAWVLLSIDDDGLIVWGHYRLTLELHERLQGHLTDPRVRSASLTTLGNCYDSLGEYRRAIDHCEQALTIDREIGDRGGQGANLGGLGNCYYRLGEYRRAIDHYEQALTIDREIGDRGGQGANLGGLGICYADLGQTATAIDHYQQALTITREIGYRQGEAIHLGNLGNCYADLGQTATAIEHYQQALTITREIGYREGEAIHLGNLGICYADLGQTDTAIDHYQQALTITREIGNRLGEANHLGNLGICYADLGQTATAIEHYQQALTITREIGNREGEANHLGNLGNCYADLGQTGTAIDHHQQALTITHEIGYRRGEATNLCNLGKCYVDLGQTATAIDHYQQALTITREIGNRQAEAIALINLGKVHATPEQWQVSDEYCRDAVAVSDAIGNPKVQSQARLALATTQLLAGNLDAAHDAAQASVGYDYPQNRARAYLVLGITRVRQGARESARAALTSAVAAADLQLRQPDGGFQALETKALALCALTLADDQDHTAEASNLFLAARVVTSAAGIITRTLRLLDTLTDADPGRVLALARLAAESSGGGVRTEGSRRTAP